MKENEPLASRTSFGIGGPADFFVEPGRTEAIEKVLDASRERAIPYFLLGAGTNLLIADAGVEGLVVRVVTREHQVEGTRIRAAAGLKMMRLARIAADADLRGFEFAIGVPGSVGGAVYQNAGCWGKELREVLVEACGFMPGSGRQTWKPGDLKFGYRTSALRDGALKGAFVVEATIQLQRGDGEEAKTVMAKLTRERNETQPIKTKNCGSVFKNPEGGLGAVRMIEECGLKEHRIGGALISPRHANFIENAGDARSADAVALMAEARRRGLEQFGVELRHEVEFLGPLELPPLG